MPEQAFSSYVLGLDTSNYTTSAALYDCRANRVLHQKKLLPVKPGEVGLRQSDAVFHHVRQLWQVMEELCGDAQAPLAPAAVGASVRPRDQEGSYMPCFLVGESFGRSLAQLGGVPFYSFSHQAGHVAAALYSVGRPDLFERRFLAFHLSGGTTECLLVEPGGEKTPLAITKLAGSLDLKAGQAIDRVGVAMGLPFPAGPAMEELAQNCPRTFSVRPVMKGMDCCLSGIENQCKARLERGESRQEVAKFCLSSIGAALEQMTSLALEKAGELPVVYAGGVMCNRLIRSRIQGRFGSALFAQPQFSADNAAGIAVLTARRLER